MIFFFCGFFFSNSTFRKTLSRMPSVSNYLDLDQGQCYVWPDMGPNGLHFYQLMTLASRQRVKVLSHCVYR